MHVYPSKSMQDKSESTTGFDDFKQVFGAKVGKKNIPMNFIVTRNICIAFIDLLIWFLSTRYANMTEIKNPFRQS